MGNMKQWVLGAALVAGGLGLAAVPAQAAEVGVYVGVGAPVAYVPPCPGPGYVWVAGYYANGYWVPGRWNFAGARMPVPVARGFVDYGRGRVVDRPVAPVRGYEHFRR